MNKSSIFFILAIGLFSFNAQAQIKLNQLSGGVSYWERSYSGNDERVFMIGYPGEGEFTKGGVMPFLGAEIGLLGNFGLDARVGFWSGKFENGARFGEDLVIDEVIDQTVIPVSLGAVYRWQNLFGYQLGAFLGAGMNRYFIENKMERIVYEETVTTTSESFSGNNYGGYGKLGLEYLFTQQLGMAIEGRYNFGSYHQNFQPSVDDEVQNYEISLQGIEAALSFFYRFDFSSEEAVEEVVEN